MHSNARRALITLVVAIAAAVLAPAAIGAENDDFTAATALQGDRGQTYIDMTDATNEAGEPMPGSGSDRTVWFTYAPDANGVARFSTCRTDTDSAFTSPTLALYSGSTLAAATELGVSHGGCPNGRANVELGAINVAAGTTYHLQLSIASDSEILGGTLVYDFNTAAPANDDFADAAAIGGSLPQTVAADNGLATTEDDEPYKQDWGPRNSLWYSWTADRDGVLSADTCSTSPLPDGNMPDSRLQILDSSSDPAELATLDSVAENDDGCGDGVALLSHAYAAVFSGRTYFIRLTNYSDDFGAAYALKLRWVGAPELATLPRVSPEAGAHAVGDELSAEHDDWQADPAIVSSTVQWQRCDAGGHDCSDIGGETGESYVIAPADIGSTLRVVVTGDNGEDQSSYASGPTSPVQDAPANDNIADAIDLGAAAPVTRDDDNYFATLEADEAAATPIEDFSASVWYRWTAPASKVYAIDTCGAFQNALAQGVAIYTSASGQVTDLTPQEHWAGGCENGRASGVFTATAGTEYYFQVGALASWAQGEFTLQVAEAPAPIFTKQPSLSGTAIAGGTLAGDVGEWTSSFGGDFTVSWAVCDAAGDNCDPQPWQQLDHVAAAYEVGKRIKFIVTVTNANGEATASALSDVIRADSDEDGVADEDDICPAEPGSKANGCDPSEIVKDTSPSISGTPKVGELLTADNGTWHTLHDPLPIEFDYQWVRCSGADRTGCANIAGATSATLTLTADDAGRYIFLNVVAHNADTARSGGSSGVGPVAAAPGGGAPPPATDPVDAFTLPRSLGKLKLSGGSITISRARVKCGTNAIGSCPGELTIVTAKSGKIKSIKQTIKFKVPPGASTPTRYKLGGKIAAAVKKAKKLKATITLKFGAPGWPAKSAKSSATLSR